MLPPRGLALPVTVEEPPEDDVVAEPDEELPPELEVLDPPLVPLRDALGDPEDERLPLV